MSYCRWSSDNYKCDLYVYPVEDGAYMIHIASTKIGDEENVPLLLNIYDVGSDNYIEAYKKQSEFLKEAKRVLITLPYAGESLTEHDLPSLKARLLELRTLGYRFPDYVFDRIDEEMKDDRIH